MDLQIQRFAGYELVASGSGRKLERFGGVLVERPSPQAIWLRDERRQELNPSQSAEYHRYSAKLIGYAD